MTFASAAYAPKKMTAKRERCLAELETAVPWAAMQALIEPHYPKGDRKALPGRSS